MFSCRQVRAGDIGNNMLLLEEILKARGLYGGALDRIFGSQMERQLTVDGICGPNTWKDLIVL